MTTIVRRALTVPDIEAFEYLLEEGVGLYALTQLKWEPKDFSAGAMKHERQRGEQLRGLYRQAQQVLPQLHISPESIKYYASLVTYYSVYRLKRLDVWLRSLYLLCFVYHRYQRFHDHVLDSLIHHVRQYMDAAHAAAKDRVYTARMEGNEHLAKAGHVLKLFTDERIAPQTPFQDVQATAFGILERQQLDMIADHIATRGRAIIRYMGDTEHGGQAAWMDVRQGLERDGGRAQAIWRGYNPAGSCATLHQRVRADR